jgi:LCP family protein required for cell wall assembly
MNSRHLFLGRYCLLGLFLLLTACNLPAVATVSPQSSPSPFPLLIIGDGTPTATPFQPIPPTATIPPPLPPTPAPPPPLATPLPAAAVSAFGNWPPPNALVPGSPPVTAVPPPSPLLSGTDTLNFLLIGSDRRFTSFRTDTLVIVSVRPKERLVTMISIPRDLFLYIPGWTMNRINTAYQQGELIKYPGGGAGMLKDTILYNLGIRIDHTAMVEFSGFVRIVNTLGGIDTPLACPFTDWHIINPNYSDQDVNNWQLYTIGPGLIHMDGDLALWYARSRLRSNDFDRGRRQQEVLRAIYAKGMQTNVIPQIPQLYNDLHDTVTTDLSLDAILQLAPLATDLGVARIRSDYINTKVVTGWRTPTGAAVLLPNRAALQALVQQAMSPAETEETESGEAVVEIWNGTTRRDWDVLTAERLHYAGFETTIAPADRRNYTQSVLYDFTIEQNPTQSNALLAALALPASALVASPDPKGSLAYRLILGLDYNPCFNPANLSH